MDLINIIEEAIHLIQSGSISQASDLIAKKAAHQAIPTVKRTLSDHQKLQIYLRDGFTDRYSGSRLLFPPILRIISLELGGVFPFHTNWKMSECHIAYWKLMPTCDHVIPIALGGADSEENAVTTSQLKNSIKSNFTLDEMEWNLIPAGSLSSWDGLISEYDKLIYDDPKYLAEPYIRAWDTALRKCQAEGRVPKELDFPDTPSEAPRD